MLLFGGKNLEKNPINMLSSNFKNKLEICFNWFGLLFKNSIKLIKVFKNI